MVKLEVILMGKLDQSMEALKIMWFFEGLEAGTERKLEPKGKTWAQAGSLWSGKQRHHEAVREAELFNHLLGQTQSRLWLPLNNSHLEAIKSRWRWSGRLSQRMKDGMGSFSVSDSIIRLSCPQVLLQLLEVPGWSPGARHQTVCPSCGGRMTLRQGQPFPTWPTLRVRHCPHCDGNRGLRLGKREVGGVESGVAWVPPPVWN